MEMQLTEMRYWLIAFLALVTTALLIVVLSLRINMQEFDSKVLVGAISFNTSFRKSVPISASTWGRSIFISDGESSAEIYISNPDKYDILRNLPTDGTFRGKVEFTCVIQAGNNVLSPDQIKAISIDSADYAKWQQDQDHSYNEVQSIIEKRLREGVGSKNSSEELTNENMTRDE